MHRPRSCAVRNRLAAHRCGHRESNSNPLLAACRAARLPPAWPGAACNSLRAKQRPQADLGPGFKTGQLGQQLLHGAKPHSMISLSRGLMAGLSTSNRCTTPRWTRPTSVFVVVDQADAFCDVLRVDDDFLGQLAAQPFVVGTGPLRPTGIVRADVAADADAFLAVQTAFPLPLAASVLKDRFAPPGRRGDERCT